MRRERMKRNRRHTPLINVTGWVGSEREAAGGLWILANRAGEGHWLVATGLYYGVEGGRRLRPWPNLSKGSDRWIKTHSRPRHSVICIKKRRPRLHRSVICTKNGSLGRAATAKEKSELAFIGLRPSRIWHRVEKHVGDDAGKGR